MQGSSLRLAPVYLFGLKLKLEGGILDNLWLPRLENADVKT